MIHSTAWIVWLVAALAVASSTRNPFYNLLILILLGLVASALGTNETTQGRKALPLLRFSAFIVVSAALFNALTSHFGSTRLFLIPGRVPLLSGPVTLEALVFGATNGLTLSAILTAFTILNAAVPVRAILRRIPQAFYPAALVASIALTFLPTTLRRVEEIREAQLLRGHRLRSLRDWLPLFLPLLIDSLERALQLAETMTARGFASEGEAIPMNGARSQLLVGLCLLLAGWLLPMFGVGRPMAGLALAGGVGVILLPFWRVSRSQARTVYRRERWSLEAGLVIAGALLAAGGLLGLGGKVLLYTPYPTLTLPGFNPWLGAAALGLAVPAVMLLLKEEA